MTTHSPGEATFFVMRSPLLPVDELVEWTQGVAAADTEPVRRELRSRLRAIVRRPDVREAIALASPGLASRMTAWLDGDDDSDPGLEGAVVRYVQRMASRPTPFGLFAGCSLGTAADDTRLTLAPRSEYRRCARLDMESLETARLRMERVSARLRPNTSLHRGAGRYRYVERIGSPRRWRYRRVAVDADPALECVLSRCAGGASIDELVNALVAFDPDYDEGTVLAYVESLVDAQILDSDDQLPVTGTDALRDLEASEPSGSLSRVREQLDRLARTAPGKDIDAYSAIRAVDDSLDLQLQVDLWKPSPDATLDAELVAEIARVADVLRKVFPAREDPTLAAFKKRFLERYGDAEVPLLEAVDDEIGLGFGGRGHDPSPLLAGLGLGAEKVASTTGDSTGPISNWLLHRLNRAIEAGDREIVLDEAELAPLCDDNAPPFPSSSGAQATLLAGSDGLRVRLDGVAGPSGLAMLGRFCSLDPELERRALRHAEQEASQHPGRVLAEIVHLPNARMGNVIARPVLREYEIPYLGRSGADRDRQLDPADLRLRLERGQLALRSVRLGRDVLPRLSSAHNYRGRSLAVYRFLATLQGQGVSPGVGWKWGPLRAAPRLPRVRLGRVIVSPETWRVVGDELTRITTAAPTERFQRLQELRRSRSLPRWVQYGDGDNRLLVDLDNPLSVDAFIAVAKGRDRAVFREHDLAAAAATGPEGQYIGEIVIPFVSTVARAAPVAPSTTRSAPLAAPPGDDWVYVKLYADPATADRVLTRDVEPFVRRCVENEMADHWHYLRFGDPDWHLRVRLRPRPDAAHALIAAVSDFAVPLARDGWIRRSQLDTYEPEINRYGGDPARELMMRTFTADSRCAVDLAGTDQPRWLCALASVDDLLRTFVPDPEARYRFAFAARASMGREFGDRTELRRVLSKRHRAHRREVDAILSGASPSISAAVRRRSDTLTQVAREYTTLASRNALVSSRLAIVASYAHMTVNRLMVDSPREHEFVIYDYLVRTYASELARSGVRVPERL